MAIVLIMRGQLRNEDYVAFLDESGDDRWTVVSGVLLPVRWMRAAEARWEHFLAHEGLRGPGELKAWKLASGRGLAQDLARRRPRPAGLSTSDHAKECGRSAYVSALRVMANLAEIRVASVAIPGARQSDAYRLWYWMACAGLTTRPRAPRPRLPMTVIDGQDQLLRRAHRGVIGDFYWFCRRRQPYVSGGTAWFVGGATLHESQHLPFVQMADLVAHAAFQSIRRNPIRSFMHDWYRDELVATAAERGRPIEVSEHWMIELRALSPPESRRLELVEAVIPPLDRTPSAANAT